MTCQEATTHTGTNRPCGKPATGTRIDRIDNTPYPVCDQHTRPPMLRTK